MRFKECLMLVLERKSNESIIITSPHGEQIEIHIIDTARGRAKVAIDAPDDYLILRDELCEQT